MQSRKKETDANKKTTKRHSFIEKCDGFAVAGDVITNQTKCVFCTRLWCHCKTRSSACADAARSLLVSFCFWSRSCVRFLPNKAGFLNLFSVRVHTARRRAPWGQSGSWHALWRAKEKESPKLGKIEKWLHSATRWKVRQFMAGDSWPPRTFPRPGLPRQ